MRLPRRYTSHEDLRVAYVCIGAGPPTLLLHGLGGTADFWQPVIERIAGHHTVIAPDLLGFALVGFALEEITSPKVQRQSAPPKPTRTRAPTAASMPQVGVTPTESEKRSR